ncbi:MAG: hypothetical protein ACJAS4_002868 [Bacteriovoracaceae bacterium]|jgi:hypothetical protein
MTSHLSPVLKTILTKEIMKNKIYILVITFLSSGLLSSPKVLAFTKLKNGFETITSTYLLPLTGAVAGAALITFITLSFFKQEEFQKKAASVIGLSIFAAVGLEVITTITQTFS